MKDKQVTFDMAAWRPSSSFFLSEVLYLRQAFPVAPIALEPDRWLLQVQPGGYIRFDHGVEEILGTHLLSDSKHLILPALDTPIKDTTSLSNVDFSKCFVEVDVVEMSMSGKKQRHTLAMVPFQSQKYGQTCEHHPTHLDFRALAAPTRHLNQLQVHLRNSEDVGVPFYTGLVGIKHSGRLKTHSGNVENTRLRLVYSTFPSCSQRPVVFYHNVIHGLGLFTC